MDVSRVLSMCFACLLLMASESSSFLKRRQKRGIDWGYTSHNGPAKWGGFCQKGTKQSPINIQLGTVIVKDFPPFHFGHDYNAPLGFTAKNNGHTIFVTLENGTAQSYISGGGLGGKFIFEQLHFHWESEHELEGKRADMEMHMVHYNAKYGSFLEAAAKPDGLVVLAVLFDESKETSKTIEDFFAYVLDASTASPTHIPFEFPENDLKDDEDDRKSNFQNSFQLRDLLPKHLSRFFRYEGSLTTPSCDEVVQWTVFINRFPVSRRVLDRVRTIRDHDNNLLTHNFRPPQKLNGRPVYIHMINYGQNSGNGRFALSFYLLCSCIFVYINFK